MSVKLPQADALSTPQTLPSTDPSTSISEYRTSLDVLVAKSLAWAHVWNPRSLENDWLAVYQYTLDDLLVRGVPKSDNRRRLVCGQRYLWTGELHRKKGPPTSTSNLTAAGDRYEGELTDNDEAGDDQWNHNQSEDEGVAAEYSINKVLDSHTATGTSETPSNDVDDDDGDSYSLASDDTMPTKKSTRNDKIPDFTVVVVEVKPLPAHGAAIPENLSTPELSCFLELHLNFIHLGGFQILSSLPDTFVEIKNPRGRRKATKRLESEAAHAAFVVDLDGRISEAVKDLREYSMVFFERYLDAIEYLAIAGSGPFWRYAIIDRGDLQEWHSKLSMTAASTCLKAFRDLFGRDYFELGTVRSDAMLNQLRNEFHFDEHKRFAGERKLQAAVRQDKLRKTLEQKQQVSRPTTRSQGC